MGMTRRDFERLARAVKDMRSGPNKIGDDAADVVARRLAVEMAQSNANFVEDRWLDACGVKRGPNGSHQA